MRNLKGSIQELFDSRYECVTESGCWIWTGAMTSTGYGIFYDKGKRIRATHLSWELYNGNPVPVGKFMCHSCDTRSCVNPRHLFPGDQKQNIVDAVSKGRMSHGQAHPKAKLSEQQVMDIKDRLANNYYYGISKDLASEYGISVEAIRDIKSGKNWSYILPDYFRNEVRKAQEE